MKRLFSILLLLTLILTAFSSCQTATNDGDLEKIQESGKLVVGMECAYAPYNWVTATPTEYTVPISNNKAGYADGYDVQIARMIADELGVELVIKAIEWDGLIPALNSNDIDMIIAGMSPTEERKLSIDFSDVYLYSNLVMVVRKDSVYASADDIQDFSSAKITAQLNTFHYDVIDQIENVEKRTALENFAALILSVTSGSIDGYVCEKPGAISAVAANNDLTYIEFEDGYGFDCDPTESSISIGMRKNSTLSDAVNAALAKIPDADRLQMMAEAIERQPIQADDDSSEAEHGFFDWIKKLLSENIHFFINGTINTLIIALTGTGIGFLIGLGIAIIRTIPIADSAAAWKKSIFKAINVILSIYVEIIRGTPMLVQALIVYYGLFMNLNIHELVAAIIIISFNTGAYMAEIVRGGIMSIDKGQFEGAHAIGMSHFQTMYHVVLPQTVKNIMPSIGNEFVVNIKDSSVLSVIAITELMFATKQAGGSAAVLPAYVICAIIYLMLTFTVTRILRLAEKKLSGPNTYTICGSQSDSHAEIHVKGDQ